MKRACLLRLRRIDRQYVPLHVAFAASQWRQRAAACSSTMALSMGSASVRLAVTAKESRIGKVRAARRKRLDCLQRSGKAARRGGQATSGAPRPTSTRAAALRGGDTRGIDSRRERPCGAPVRAQLRFGGVGGPAGALGECLGSKTRRGRCSPRRGVRTRAPRRTGPVSWARAGPCSAAASALGARGGAVACRRRGAAARRGRGRSVGRRRLVLFFVRPRCLRRAAAAPYTARVV